MPGHSGFPNLLIEASTRDACRVLEIPENECDAILREVLSRAPSSFELLLGEAVIALTDRLDAAEGRPRS